MKFCFEKIADALEEAKPLLKEHWAEIATFKDIELNPDYDRYLMLEKTGYTKSYSARDGDGRLCGYAVYFLFNHMHYKQALYAQQDILYVLPEQRRMGGLFIKYCDEELKKCGVVCVTQHVKASLNFGTLLERIGYTLQDLIYIRRLNGS